MKASLAALMITALAANITYAADLPVKAPAAIPLAPIYNWTGCYIGGNIGGSEAGMGVTINGIRDFDRTANGIAGGGQIGCDYQFASNWVVGLQLMLDATGIDESRVSGLFPADTFRAHVRGFGTVTGRFGYTITPAFLLYSKFGWGTYSSDLILSDTLTGVQLASAGKTQSGFDLGVGGEWMFAPNWSLWIEWDHIFAQDDTFLIPALGVAGSTADVRRDFDKVLVGVNWRFSTGGAPVRANY
jgi:outer membrane immunogenic protein